MNRYKFRIPMHLEYVTTFSDGQNLPKSLEFNYYSEYRGVKYILKNEEENYFLFLENVEAEDIRDALEKVELFTREFVSPVTLIIQLQNKCQNWSYCTPYFDLVNYEKLGEEIILLENNCGENIYICDKIRIREELFATMKGKLKLDSLGILLDEYSNNSEMKFLLDCFFRAVSSEEILVRYFNSFTIIEFIEARYSKFINTSRLVDNAELVDILSDLENALSGNKNKNRIVERIKQNLKSATLESRAEKLEQCIKKIFEVEEIEVPSGKKEVTLDLLKKIINTRNQLYHGKVMNESEKRELESNSYLLILVVQTLLSKWEKFNEK